MEDLQSKVATTSAKGFGRCIALVFHFEICLLPLCQGPSGSKLTALSGPAIRTPTFRRFARIDSQKIPIFEALDQIRANRVSLRFALKFAGFASNPRCYFLEGQFAKKGVFFCRESRIDSQRIFAICVRIANRCARIDPLSDCPTSIDDLKVALHQRVLLKYS